MAGLGRIPRFSIDIKPEVNRGGEEKFDVVGQLCTPLDCLARNLASGEERRVYCWARSTRS